MDSVIVIIGMLSLLPFSISFCPDTCVCDNESSETSCIKTNLWIIHSILETHNTEICFAGDAYDFESQPESFDTEI